VSGYKERQVKGKICSIFCVNKDNTGYKANTGFEMRKRSRGRKGRGQRGEYEETRRSPKGHAHQSTSNPRRHTAASFHERRLERLNLTRKNGEAKEN